MTTTRAKFRVNAVTFHGDHTNPDTPRTYELTAVYDTSNPENARFTKATPWGELKMRVDNPAAHLKAGEMYYLDFTPCSDVEVDLTNVTGSAETRERWPAETRSGVYTDGPH